MLDRASTFALPELLQLLRDDLIAVAIDQAYQRRQQDAEGEFYRRIAAQSPRSDFGATTQGFYVATAAGDLLLYNNNRDPQKVERLVREAVAKHRTAAKREAAAPIDSGAPDRRWHAVPPEGGLVVRVHGKVLGGYGEAKTEFARILHAAVSRDNLWITAAERKQLVAGELPETLLRRIARFHLVDATRGEPPMWREDEVQELKVARDGEHVRGTVRLSTKDGERRLVAELRGRIVLGGAGEQRFELVCLGTFAGEGPYTRGAPAGEFPLALTFVLADGTDAADAVPPQGSRGWLAGYLR
ncbi:MAG: hypothetical protein RL398_3035 [Planctomycetota bacterium]